MISIKCAYIFIQAFCSFNAASEVAHLTKSSYPLPETSVFDKLQIEHMIRLVTPKKKNRKIKKNIT